MGAMRPQWAKRPLWRTVPGSDDRHVLAPVAPELLITLDASISFRLR
jgi:hypothetical protein